MEVGTHEITNELEDRKRALESVNLRKDREGTRVVVEWAPAVLLPEQDRCFWLS